MVDACCQTSVVSTSDIYCQTSVGDHSVLPQFPSGNPESSDYAASSVDSIDDAIW